MNDTIYALEGYVEIPAWQVSFFGINTEAEKIRQIESEDAEAQELLMAEDKRREEEEDDEERRNMDMLLLQQDNMDMGGVRDGARSAEGKKTRPQARANKHFPKSR